MKKIILASASPRRRELLELAGFDFEVIPSDCEENSDISDPAEMVLFLSQTKAENVALKRDDDCLVIGADTVVVKDGNILGKPKDENEAYKMLKSLAGDAHYVYTGVTIIDLKSGNKKSFYEKTTVNMFDVSDDEIRQYILSGDPFDKAGGYGVQSKGLFLVSGINGDFYNVVGLPIARLIREIKDIQKDC